MQRQDIFQSCFGFGSPMFTLFYPCFGHHQLLSPLAAKCAANFICLPSVSLQVCVSVAVGAPVISLR